MPQLVYFGGRFIFRCDFAERDLPKKAGFRWLADTRRWYTDDPVAAARLRAFASDDETRRQLDQLVIVETPWTEPLPLPPRGLSLMPHQTAALLFALSRNRSYLGLDPGLGKTIVAAMASHALSTAGNFSGSRTVYVCPPFLVKNVIFEYKRWAPLLSVKPLSSPSFFDADVLVVPDSIVHRKEAHQRIKRFVEAKEGTSVVFVDEAHRFKNPEAKRTRAVLGERKRGSPVVPGIVDLFDRQVYMSGTPMPNRPIELYPVLSKAAPETIGFANTFQYALRYCAAHETSFGWDFSGASNLDELRSRVIAPSGKFMLRLKKSVLSLPPKLEEVFVLSEDLSPRLAEMDHTLGKRYSSAEDLIKYRLAEKAGKDGDELHVATYRRLLGIEKAKAAISYLEAVLEETDEDLIVFGYHTEAIGTLYTGLSRFNPIVITGETTPAERDSLVRMFQNSKSRRLIIGNYLAMGVGFTLTKASRVVFVEFDWVPAVNDQASDRAHRIGQEKTVLVQYMVYENSIDKAVVDTLLRKRKVTEYV